MVALVVFGASACTTIIGIGTYRNCQGAECALGNEAGTDATGDAAPAAQCTTLADCPANKGYAMCTSEGHCAKVTALARGSSQHMCVLIDDAGKVVCWGTNDHAQLGAPIVPFRKEPMIVAGIPPMTSVGVGIDFTCALSKLGEVWCWGTGTAGNPNDPQGTPAQATLPPGHKGIALSVGQSDACVILDDQSIRCWGDNLWGESGCSVGAGRCSSNGGSTSPKSATIAKTIQIANGSEGYGRVAVGIFQTCAMVVKTGQVHCWGVTDHLGLDVSTAFVCCAQSDLGPPTPGPAQDLVSTEFYACRKDDTGIFDCWAPTSRARSRTPTARRTSRPRRCPSSTRTTRTITERRSPPDGVTSVGSPARTAPSTAAAMRASPTSATAPLAGRSSSNSPRRSSG